MTIKSSRLKVLDCTIRDGGYFNNWNFDVKFVREVYSALSKSGVDYVELGFRSSDKYFDPEKFGIWRFTSEDRVSEVVKNISGASVALMLDFGKFDLEDIPQQPLSPVGLYRLACHKPNVKKSIDLCNEIKGKGYEVSLQLMGIATYTEEDYDKIIPEIKRSTLDYIYIADSYGSLFPQDISTILNRLKKTGKKIGFHAHNNLQLAFANTLEALYNGADIVDGTVFGMGRGAGNLPIEVLISYLERTLKNKRYNVLPVLELIDQNFYRLKKELKWGYNLPYMLSGIFNIHPNYSKNLVDYQEFTIEDIWRALEVIQEFQPVGFKRNLLNPIIESGFVDKTPSTSRIKDSKGHNNFLKDIDGVSISYHNRHEGRDFLVLANGPSLKEFSGEIGSFIEKLDPIIMGANYLGGLFIPTYHAFSNKKRFIDYVSTVNKKSKLLLSSNFVEKFIKEHYSGDFEYLYHSPQLRDFGINDRGVILSNCRTVSVLLIGVSIVMGAKNVFVAGMDGYKEAKKFLKHSTHFYNESREAEDYKILMEKHKWNERLLNQIDSYLTNKGKEGINIITPTSHKRFYKSIYNFL